MALILIIDDDVELASTLAETLRSERHDVRIAHDGRDGFASATTAPLPDLIILDLLLPDLPGTQVCRSLRESEVTRETPVIICTVKDEEADRIAGFEAGADDYIVKPFSTRELTLRIRALLRRKSRPDRREPLRCGRLKIDLKAHRVWVDDEEIVLTALEFKLLSVFVARRGRVQTREALLFDVWEIEGDVTSRTVDTHVKRLRNRLGVVGDYIETLRGVGYRFVATVDE